MMRFGNERRIVWVELDGERLSLSAAARARGMSPAVVIARVRRLGWTLERALSTPVTKPGSRWLRLANHETAATS